MRTLLHTMMKRASASTILRAKARHDDDQKVAANMAIAAWSEIMGREAAELWVAANRAGDTGMTPRPS